MRHSLKKIFTKLPYNRDILSFLKKNKSVVITTITLTILGDILFINNTSDFLIFGILAFYVGSIWFFKLKSKVTFSLCLFFLIVMFIEFMILGTEPETEKAAVWSVLLMGVGILQQWNE